MGLIDILTGPVKAVIQGANDILGKFIASPEQKLEAQLAFQKLQQDMMTEVLKAQADFAAQQASVINTEANGHSWLQRNWRPIFALTLVAIIFFNYLYAPIFHVAVLPTPDRMWDLMELCLGGYIGGRTVEKVVPPIVDAVKPIKK